MVIDIISYTDAQFAALTEEQLLQVKSAQLKKNRLTAKLQTDLQKEKHRLIENGTYLSTMWQKIQSQLRSVYEQEVANIRDALLFYLRFAAKPEDSETGDVPYTVDYSLSDVERFNIVKTYYEATYSDGVERFAAFKEDKIAPQYLGELYAPLYDYFLEDT
ncbi:MAG: hypothetical protein E7349_04625 [Clostridiales bacterium]|nr:hypothetical protein [Clostridiales bacterium]